MSELIRYDAACRAVAEARSVDEVKDIRDKAVAMQVYAKQANNKQLEADAWEIRKRAEYRAGALLREMELNKGGAEKGVGRRGSNNAVPAENRIPAPKLSDLGVTKSQSSRWQAFAETPRADLEVMIAKGRDDFKRSVERAAESKVNRRERHQAIAAKASLSIKHLGPFPLIYADPPWKWGHFGEKDQENEKGKGRTPDQHYPTLTYDEIESFQINGKLISEIAAKDAALFLWCTSANILFATEVMRVWGFAYKAHAVWDKERTGLGLVFRNQHELLLYGTRGAIPGPQHQPPSIFRFPRGRHSAKPPEIRAVIERMYPDFSALHRLELFARETVPGWTAYGFESEGASGVAPDLLATEDRSDVA